MTGVVSVVASLAPKLIQTLREILPSAKRVGILHEPSDPRARTDLAALRPPAEALGVTLVVAEVTSAQTLASVVTKLLDQRVDAVITSTSLIFNLRSQLLQLTNAKRVPVVGHRSEVAEAGAIFSYGASLSEQLERAAILVDKVLKGASTADIPIEQPTRFELVINLIAARALDVNIPTGVLVRADRVIG